MNKQIILSVFIVASLGIVQKMSAALPHNSGSWQHKQHAIDHTL
jgi:hypothetical protein